MLDRRAFLLGSAAMAAAALLPWRDLLPNVGCIEQNHNCTVHPRIYIMFNEGLMVWSADNDPTSWQPVGQPLAKSPETGVATFSNVLY